MKLLHILATPRSQVSNTLPISKAFLKGLNQKYDNLKVETIDLFNYDIPSIAGENIETKYQLMAGLKIDSTHESSWKEIEALIRHFLTADVYLITCPMWNLSIPYTLKYYIDCIVQPGYLFRYNELGQIVGLVTGKQMVCITSRGGDYSEQSLLHTYDFQEPYLRAIFGMCGITNIDFINAHTMDITSEIRQHSIQTATLKAQELGTNFNWIANTTAV